MDLIGNLFLYLGLLGIAVFRKALVITQFSLTIIMNIGTIIIYSQLKFMRNKSLGFDQDHLVVLSMTRPLYEKYDDFDNLYRSERRIGTIVRYFSVLAANPVDSLRYE